MRLLVESIVATLSHHGNECANITFDRSLVIDLIGNDDEERVDEIMKCFETLRHQLGSSCQVARDLLRLIRYER